MIYSFPHGPTKKRPKKKEKRVAKAVAHGFCGISALFCVAGLLRSRPSQLLSRTQKVMAKPGCLRIRFCSSIAFRRENDENHKVGIGGVIKNFVTLQSIVQCEQSLCSFFLQETNNAIITWRRGANLQIRNESSSFINVVRNERTDHHPRIVINLCSLLRLCLA